MRDEKWARSGGRGNAGNKKNTKINLLLECLSAAWTPGWWTSKEEEEEEEGMEEEEGQEDVWDYLSSRRHPQTICSDLGGGGAFGCSRQAGDPSLCALHAQAGGPGRTSIYPV